MRYHGWPLYHLSSLFSRSTLVLMVHRGKFTWYVMFSWCALGYHGWPLPLVIITAPSTLVLMVQCGKFTILCMVNFCFTMVCYGIPWLTRVIDFTMVFNGGMWWAFPLMLGHVIGPWSIFIAHQSRVDLQWAHNLAFLVKISEYLFPFASHLRTQKEQIRRYLASLFIGAWALFNSWSDFVVILLSKM